MSSNPIHVSQLQNANGSAQAAVIRAQQENALARTGETAATAMAAKMQALIQARYTVAYARPRDMDEVRERLLRECRRPSFARVAEYNKPVGDGVKGPSIRFAETAIRCMTNIVIDTSVVYDDERQRIVHVSITDLESNVPYEQDVTIEKSVERSRVKEGDIVLRERLNSYNKKVYTIVATDDEILNKQNALISKAIRTQALRLVPGDLIDEGMRVCREVRAREDAKDPDAAKRAIYDAFAELGVTIQQIKEYLGHDASTLNPAELDTLRGLYAALRDGETTWREIMDNRQSKQDTNTKTTARNEQPQAEPQRNTAKAEPSEPQQQAEPAPSHAEPKASGAPTFEEVISDINKAKTIEALDDVKDLIRSMPEDKQQMLLNMVENKAARLAERQERAAQATQPQQQSQPVRRTVRSRILE